MQVYQASKNQTGLYIDYKKIRSLNFPDIIRGTYATRDQANGWKGRPVSEAQRKLYNGMMNRYFLRLDQGLEPLNQGQASELIEAIKKNHL